MDVRGEEESDSRELVFISGPNKMTEKNQSESRGS